MKHHAHSHALIWLGSGATALFFAALAPAQTTLYPPVNTNGVNFANGVEMRNGRVLLVQNGGYFVKNGQVLMNQAQMIAAVDQARGRMPERHYTRRERAPQQASFLARVSAGSPQVTPVRNGAGGMRQMLAGVFGKARRA